MLEIVRGAVRRLLKKISNCTFECDYYYYYQSLCAGVQLTSILWQMTTMWRELVERVASISQHVADLGGSSFQINTQMIESVLSCFYVDTCHTKPCSLPRHLVGFLCEQSTREGMDPCSLFESNRI